MELITSSHENYDNDIIGSNFFENAKCFWSYVKLKRTDNVVVPTLIVGTKVCDSIIDETEAINKYFHNIFSKPPQNITLFDDVSPFESIP